MAAAEGSERGTLSNAVEDYLKAIYSLEEGSSAAVTTTALAERLAVTPGSASAMAKRLDELGLVAHVPYRGVKLSVKGRQLALEIVRHHRLLERFLSEELDVPWDRVHAEADVLEHVLSEDLEERIAAKLGHPAYDPHGDPIPSRDGQVEERETRALADLDAGERGVLARVSDSNPDVLRYLAGLGLAPGEELEVVRQEPFGGPLVARLGKREIALGRELTEVMRVTPERG